VRNGDYLFVTTIKDAQVKIREGNTTNIIGLFSVCVTRSVPDSIHVNGKDVTEEWKTKLP
jgi:hypothetical protein